MKAKAIKAKKSTTETKPEAKVKITRTKSSWTPVIKAEVKLEEKTALTRTKSFRTPVASADAKPEVKTPLTRSKSTRATTPVTAQEIIEAFTNSKQLQLPSVDKYHQLHKQLESSFGGWSDAIRLEFLTPFLEMPHLLGAICHELVYVFCSLHWPQVPASIRTEFVEFLSLLAVYHVYHVESVLRSATTHLAPMLNNEVDEKTQEEIYHLAFDCINTITECIPMYGPVLTIACQKSLPFRRQPFPNRWRAYVSNIIKLTEKYPSMTFEVWMMILKNLIMLNMKDDLPTKLKKRLEKDDRVVPSPKIKRLVKFLPSAMDGTSGFDSNSVLIILQYFEEKLITSD